MVRPAHEPTAQTRRTVESMSAFGIPQAEICKVIGINTDTLSKYYREELDTAKAKANAKVAQTLYAKATSDEMSGPSVTAAIFWLKTRAQWKETSAFEVGGPNGDPLPVSLNVAFGKD